MNQREMPYNALMIRGSQKGLALLLVTFIVALASIIVVNLTYSTYLGSILGLTAERSVQAEYVLKSAVNFARVLIKEDITDEDSMRDEWGRFANGLAVPPELLGMAAQNVLIELEIRPEGAKLNVNNLVPRQFNGQPDLKYRRIFERLFTLLQFDQDEEEQASGPAQGEFFGVKEMVANLIDYMDPDEEPYDADGFRGIENERSGFSNNRISRLEELAAVPGFTPARVQRLLPFLTAYDNFYLNLNLAPRILLLSLHPDLEEAQIDQIIAFRSSEEGPFQNTNKLAEFIPDDSILSDINPLLTHRNQWFQVLAKVDYGTSTYYMRALLSKNSKGELPDIRKQEIF
ncbi:MAG: general secretion pathway protein GspK [Deltaproteobacteria bacterium]|nr:general secretion pathway protein GspK [Deltaproteobacteria bacterium]